MKYTIVWNQNKTEGIILSGDDQLKIAEYTVNHDNRYGFGISPVAYRFRDHFGLTENCTIQNGLVPLQPTDEMILAGSDAYFESREIGQTSHEMVVSIWLSMVQEMNK